MITTLTGIYKKSDIQNSNGIRINSTDINSPIRTGFKKLNTINQIASNTINDIFLYPKNIIVNGIKYTESLSRTFTDNNQYFYDALSNQILFPQPVRNVVIDYYFNNLIEGDIDLALGYPILDAKLGRGWMEQPTGSITLAVPLEGLESHLERLRPGTEFLWLGVGLVIISLSVTHNSQFTSLGLLSVILQLSGKWSGYLKPSQYTDNRSNNIRLTTLQQLAERNKAVLEFPTYPIVIPKDKTAESFDWASILDNVAKNSYQYVYWSDSNAIKLKDIETESTDTIIDPIDSVKVNQPNSYEFHADYQLRNIFNYNSGAESYTTLLNQYDKIYYPYTLTPFIYDKVKITSNIYFYPDGRVKNDLLQYITGVNFKYRNRQQLTIVSGSRNLPFFAIGKVKDLSIAPDITGYTQTYKVITTLDEKPTREIEEVWGFLVNSDNKDQSLSSTWSMISYTVTTHQYNGLGYYLGYRKSGWKMERFDQEDPKNPETLNEETRKIFSWTKIPFSETYSITLAPFYKYYLSTNSLEGFYEDNEGFYRSDPSFIEPMFVISEVKITNSIEVEDNPDNEGYKITKGIETINIKEVKPYSPVNLPYYSSPSNYSTDELKELTDKEGYYLLEQNHSSEGGQFNTSISSNNGEFISGKPSIAASLPPVIEKSQVTLEDKYKPPLLSKFFKSIIVTENDYNGDNRGKTISYPEASTLDDIKNCLAHDWIVNNVKNGITVEFTIQGIYKGYEGQCITLIADNIFYKGIILSINYDLKTSIESFRIKNLDSKTQIKIGLIPENNPFNSYNIKFIRNNSVKLTKILYTGSPFESSALLGSRLGRYSL